MRPVQIGGLEFLAFRYTATTTLTQETLDLWRGNGIRIAAVHIGDAPPSAPQLIPELGVGDEAILCGPAEAVRRLFAS